MCVTSTYACVLTISDWPQWATVQPASEKEQLIQPSCCHLRWCNRLQADVGLLPLSSFLLKQCWLYHLNSAVGLLGGFCGFLVLDMNCYAWYFLTHPTKHLKASKYQDLRIFLSWVFWVFFFTKSGKCESIFRFYTFSENWFVKILKFGPLVIILNVLYQLMRIFFK